MTAGVGVPIMSDLQRFLDGLGSNSEPLDSVEQNNPFSRDDFDEETYLRLNPDVSSSVAKGDIASGYIHYVMHGFLEGRPTGRGPTEMRNTLLRTKIIASAPANAPAFSCEAVICSAQGGIMVIGWVDDTASPLVCLRVSGKDWRILLDPSSIIRIRRQDVESALGKPVVHLFGVLGFVATGEAINANGPFHVEMFLEDNTLIASTLPGQAQDDVGLRDTLLTMIGQADFYGNPAVERVGALDAGFGEQILTLNRSITRRMTSGPYVERFGQTARKLKGSIVVVLYGKAEYLFAQNALYSALPGIEDYEFIYASNSPELGETLLREARLGSRIHGIAQTVVVLPGNAGFGAANNAAVAVARSRRILNVNPDVFPRDPDWAAKHTVLVEGGKRDGTRIFGVPLYYDDGSLMHGGMYIDMDTHISATPEGFARRRLARVEHYGKGAPPEATGFLRARPVPAVTGAFISSDRAWYEKLGGFDESFVYGHYEDADLCLRSLAAGTPVWMQDLRLWHLEGKGSTRLPAHEGGSVINRWIFTRRWGQAIEQNLLGPEPRHELLNPVAA